MFDKKRNTKNLRQRGRMQFFYHLPESKLPIRDVLNRHGQGIKTEPHIECSAENYWDRCCQTQSVAPLLDNNERYLFLVTNCQNPEFGKRYGSKLVVGYIDVQGSGVRRLWGGYFRYVFGETKLVGFNDAVLWTGSGKNALGYSHFARSQKIDQRRTRMILERLKDKDNILEACVAEIQKFDPEGKTCLKSHSRPCPLEDRCLRFHPSKDQRVRAGSSTKDSDCRPHCK